MAGETVWSGSGACSWCGKTTAVGNVYCGERCEIEASNHAQAEYDEAHAEAEEAHANRVATWKTVTLTVQCPHKNCSGDITVSMPNERSYGHGAERGYADGKITVNCETCSEEVEVIYRRDDSSGIAFARGPKGLTVGDEEDLSIKEDRVCKRCRHYKSALPTLGWLLPLIVIVVLVAIYGALIAYVRTNWGDVTLFGFNVVNIAKYGVGGIVILGFLKFLGSLADESDVLDIEDACLSKDIKRLGRLKEPGWKLMRMELCWDYNRNLRCKFWKEATTVCKVGKLLIRTLRFLLLLALTGWLSYRWISFGESPMDVWDQIQAW
jgi:hypothetical protein